MLKKVEESNWQPDIAISVSIKTVSYNNKNRYVKNLYVRFSENLFGLSIGYCFSKPLEELKNILTFLLNDVENIESVFSFNNTNEFKKELNENDCLHLFNLTPIQIFNRLLKSESFFPSYRNNKLYLLKKGLHLHLFGLPRKREDKILIPKKLHKYFKFIADDFEEYCNNYKNPNDEFEPRKEIEYRKLYPKNLSDFLDMGKGVDDSKYICKCGFTGYYKEFVLGSNAGFAGTFIKQCPSCKREKGDMYERLFNSNTNEDFEVKLEVKNNHFFKI